MCGICGYISKKDLNIKAMTSTLGHRGPDFQDSSKLSERIHFGHSRLSILDLSSAANQPMTTGNGRFTIVYNGEIYNFKNIREELEKLGKKFSNNSDTEVILYGYEQWGMDLLEKLNGIFAFAVYDNKTDKLILARDRFGVKPLYYYHRKNEFLFGSEIKALLASKIIKKEIDFQGLNEYLYFCTSFGETTCFKNVKKLLPGHYISIDGKAENMKIKKYASIYNTEKSSDSLSEAADKTAELLENSVKRQLLSDVPVGIFLSGGIDSSAITAFASRYFSGKIKTFSAGFDFDKGHNELPMAKYVADYYGTEHHEMHIRGADLKNVLGKLIEAHDQPFGDAANIPLYLLTQKLKGSIKVVLQGDGGDEIFAGYDRYNRLGYDKFAKFLSYAFPILDKLYDIKPYCSVRKLNWLYALYQKNTSHRYAWIMSQESYKYLPYELMSDEIQKKLHLSNAFVHFEKLYKKFADLDTIQRALYTDCHSILPDIFFEKVDKATMASGVEARVPFLDNELAAYVMSLPSNYKVQKNMKKYLLRKSLRNIVPDKVLNAEKKGFGVPFQNWLKEPLADYMKEVVLDSKIKSSKLFKHKILSEKIDEHISGKTDHGNILYKILNLAIWYNKYF